MDCRFKGRLRVPLQPQGDSQQGSLFEPLETSRRELKIATSSCSLNSVNNEVLKYGFPNGKTAYTGSSIHCARNARENPLQPKTRAKVGSKVIRFLWATFEKHAMELSSLSSTNVSVL